MDDKVFNAWTIKNSRICNYPLEENSLVFDVGGYKGDWANEIHEKYNCNVFIFEPVKSFYNFITKRFSNLDKIKIFNLGLSDNTRIAQITVDGDTSSFYAPSTKKPNDLPTENAYLKSITEFLEENNIEKVDLIKINVEGEEYVILEKILKYDPKIFGNIQVQFHRFVENCECRRNKIRDQLSATHELTYDFEFIWENWRIKS